MKTWRAQLAGAVLIVVMAVSLGIEASHLPRKATTSSLPSLTPIAHRTCAQAEAVGDNVGTTQRNDGAFSACLRVGSVAPGTYQVVARGLESKIASSATANAPGTWMTLAPPSGPPGSVVTISGYVPNTTADQRRNDHAELCWAACNALTGSVEINWSASQTGRFTTQFTAPAAPWFAGSKVAPLRPGRYAVLFACLPAFEKPSGLCGGGALGSHFDLTGTGSGLCTGGKNCAVVQTSPAEGPPGTLVAVDGWAPLTGLNGTGFIDAAIEGQPRGKPGSQNPSSMIASVPFTITGAQGWAGLPAMHPVTIQRTGMDPIGADPGNSRRFAYCGNGAIKLTTNAGSTWSTISLAGVRAASAPTNYPIPGSFTASLLSCASVALDSRYPGTLYAVFSAVPRNSGPPPFYFVAYVTRNSGRTWQPVPVPAKSEMGRFGGFRVSASGVQALFWWETTTDSSQAPQFLVEQTTDGGRTWPAASLRCPVSGPCIGLGPQDNGRCMAVGEWQAIEISSDGGRSWSSPGWPSRLSACTTSELVGLGSNSMVAVDQMGPYPLMSSSDGGSSWEDVALPLLPGADADPGNLQGSLQILPDGRLLLAGYRWYLLGSGATAWCSIAAAPPISNGEWSASPLLIGDRLYWSDPTAGAAVGVTPRSFPISAVHC